MISVKIERAPGCHSSPKEVCQMQKNDVGEIQRQLPGKVYPGKKGRGRA